MRHTLLRSFVAVVLVALFAASAAAHFVWIETKPVDAGLLVRSGFGEPDGWDPDLAEKIGQTTYRLRTPAGLTPLSLPLDKTEKEYRGTITDATANAVIGVTDWGIFSMGRGPAHLRYTSKTLIGPSAAWGDDKPTADLRIETLAKLDGKNVVLKVLHLGKPLAGAKINYYPPSGEKADVTTGDDGTALLPTSGAGPYRLYVGTTTKTAGELDGKKFEALSDYTTLTFTLE
jgi:hypothetical protein